MAHNNRLLNRHLCDNDGCDNDGRMRQYVEVGAGMMNFKAIADAVKAVRFGDWLSLEQDSFRRDMRDACRRYSSIMNEYLS